MSQPIKLLVGLANPGPEYSRTRHNAGAWVVEELARIHNITLKNEPKYFGLTGRIVVNGEDLRLLIPTTFMNLSGKAVAALAKFYQIQPEEIMLHTMNLISLRVLLSSKKAVVMAVTMA